MSIEKELEKAQSQIDALHRKLAKKRAYLSANVIFTDKSIPDDIKEEISKEIKQMCIQLSTEQDKDAQIASPDTGIAGISKEDLSILKTVVSAVKDKARKPVNEKGQVTTLKDIEQGLVKSSKLAENSANILTLDNIDINMRQKIDRTKPVVVIEEKDGNAFVQDRRTNRFWVPIMDLEYTE